MSKSVIISLKPEWCEKIFSGVKTIEVRKTKPKLETPFKCYVYETKTGYVSKSKQNDNLVPIKYRGKVIGEFVVDGINQIFQCNSGFVAEYGCINKYDFFEYLGIPQGTHFGYDKYAFAWHITDVILYDKPRELNDFIKPCDKKIACEDCYCFDTVNYMFDGYFSTVPHKNFCKRKITRPPQSWCYVEEV